MSDRLLSEICRLESWLQTEGRRPAKWPLWCLGSLALVAILMASNVAAIISLLLPRRRQTARRPAMPGVPIAATSDTMSNLVRTHPRVLVDFWAPWCGPCLLMKPAVEQVADDLSDQWVVLTVNTTSQSRLASEYRIDGLPTLIVIVDGQEIERRVGAANLAELRTWMRAHSLPLPQAAAAS